MLNLLTSTDFSLEMCSDMEVVMAFMQNVALKKNITICESISKIYIYTLGCKGLNNVFVIL